MKRVGYLMEKIADYDNIQLAYLKASRGKQAKREVLEFRKNYEENIRLIRTQLLDGSIAIGAYNYFTIYDPKERLICAAKFNERIVHHAVMNVCHDIFDRRLIYDTYATRRNKGVYAALEKAKNSAATYRYMVKLDFRKYFDSISHDVLKSQLVRIFKDEALLALLYNIIDSYETAPGRGLPIGNLTSQYFANHYLSELDHMMKEQLRIPVYIRYMDDILMMAHDKDTLRQAVVAMIDYSKHCLKLHLKSPIYRTSRIGMPFLGYVVKPRHLLLTGRSKRRLREKTQHYRVLFERGELSEYDYQQHLMPLFAFVSYAQCVKFRQQCI